MNTNRLFHSSLQFALFALILGICSPATSFGQSYHSKREKEANSGPANRDKAYKTYKDKDNGRTESARRYDNSNRPGSQDQATADRGRGPNDGNRDRRPNGNKNDYNRGNGHNGGKYANNRYRDYRPDDSRYQPAHRRSPNWSYANMPRRGAVVTNYPGRAEVIRYRGTPYYYHGGVFYKAYQRKYVVVRPPIGLRIQVIPPGYRIINAGGNRYYYYYGTYYVSRGRYYETVNAPIGSLVESIPDGYEKLIIDGDTYYIVDGVQYRAVLYDGEIWYEVIKIDC